jgi:hypothetical protein
MGVDLLVEVAPRLSTLHLRLAFRKPFDGVAQHHALEKGTT